MKNAKHCLPIAEREFECVHMDRCLTFCLGDSTTTLLSISGMNLWVQVLAVLLVHMDMHSKANLASLDSSACAPY